MKIRNAGLILGGGGAKGAYQIGVFCALKEYKLDKHIKYVAGTSIGAINGALFLNNNIEHAAEIWNQLSKQTILTKKTIKEYLNLTKPSIYSRRGFLELLNQHVDLAKIAQSPIECYVTATNIKEKRAEYFLINGKDAKSITDYILASSALPLVFESIKIEDSVYNDGFKFDNVPIRALRDKNCDLLFVVSLSVEYYPTLEELECADKIIDFRSDVFNRGKFREAIIDFDPENLKARIDAGYFVAKKLIEELRKKNIIELTFFEKFRGFFRRLFHKEQKIEQKYFYLEDEHYSEEEKAGIIHFKQNK